MSASSTIGNLQSALNCAGKCDCCAKLQAQIDAINAKLITEGKVRLIAQNVVDESKPTIVQTTKLALQPDISAAVAGGIVVVTTKLQPQIDNGISTARTALAKAFSAESASTNAESNSLAAKRKAEESISEAVKAKNEALSAKNEAGTATATARGANTKAVSAESTANQASSVAGTAKTIANHAFDESHAAINKSLNAERVSTSSLEISRAASLESELAKGIANQADFKAGNAVNQSTTAISTAARASKEALDASNAVGGLKGIINGIGAKVNQLGELIGKVEKLAGDAITKAAKAVGISSEALAATGRLAGKVLEIFNALAAIATLIEQLQTLLILGDRIDAIENAIVRLGNDVSGILGKLLGLQNRISRNEATIGEVKNIALDAKGIGEAARLQAGAAQVTATRAEAIGTTANSNALQAQLTADGAVRNAATANANATTAYKKATEAQGIGEQAKSIAGDALGKAGTALTTALTAIALYQGFKALRGLQGIPGIPGRDGRNGIDGRQGIPGRDGITTVVQVPGQPGRDGAPGRQGFPGRNGVNGRDGNMNPADLASLRGFIAAQHTTTRASAASAIGGLKTFVGTGFTALTALTTAIGSSVVFSAALNVMTFAATIHNALMLSNNLGQTLISIIDQVTGFLLPKGIDGTPISLSTVLGKAAHEIIADTIGEANYRELSEDFQKANRIYQAASNVFNQITNLGGIITAGLEVVAGNVAQIGNALKKWGAVGEKAYNFMNPQPNLKGKFFTFLNNANEKAQAIAMVVAIPIAIKEALGGINTSVADLKREISQTDPKDEYGRPILDSEGKVVHYKPGLEIPVPIVVEAKENQSKADSTNFLELVLEDIFDGGD
ncbi:MAG: hypothetical protein V7K98_12335 [Nostoc sp.]|uniref:hypothetical protein n=1 Tax=Nostoc sp. TaxID=1180 RepID=UPI002FF5EE24